MASATQELDVFVREALLRGHDREEIGQALVAAGWSREQADSALAGYADVRFPIPVPRPRASLSAREAFLYLVMFSALYFTAYNLGSLLSKLLELALPDPADPTYRQLQLGHSMRWSIAAVKNIARIAGAGPLMVIDTDVVGEQRSKPAYSSRMSSTVAIETPEVPTLP